VIFDYDHYLDIYPRLKKVTLLSHVGNVYTAEFLLDASLTTLTYTTINTLAADKMRMSWVTDMNRPHKYFKRNDGYWQLEEVGPGQLVGEYHVEVELDLGIFTGIVSKIVRSMSRDDLPDVMVSTRKRMESGGTWKRPGR
jgi:ribosome-associated toxin RatA of RatAB toxin-antitoxin module